MLKEFRPELVHTDGDGNLRQPPIFAIRLPISRQRLLIDPMRVGAWVSILTVLAGSLAGVWWFWTVGLTWFDIALAVLGSWFCGLGITISYHRYFTHRAFTAKPWVAALLGIWGAAGMQGQIVTWASVHRRHHRHCDTDADPHTPKSMGAGFKAMLEAFIDGYVGWTVSGRLFAYVGDVRDLRRNKVVQWVDSYYWVWVALGWIVPGLMGMAWYGNAAGFWSGFFAGGAIRALLHLNFTGAVNTFGHLVGRRRFSTRDDSTNNVIAMISMTGEHLHNNHHAIPWSASFAFFKSEFDPGFLVLKGLARLGLVGELRTPSEQFVARRSAATLDSADAATAG